MPSIFIAGASGSQAQPLALKLRDLGWVVRTTSRDPASDKAKALADAGVEVLAGNWDDVEALTAAMRGCEKLFFTLVAYIDDPDRELRQADNMVRAAKAAGVKHVVASTSIGVATYGSGPHADFYETVMRIKSGTERAVREAGFEACAFLRPALFMSNLLAPQVDYFFPGFRQDGVCRSAMRADTRVAFLDTGDLSKVALAVVLDAERYNGQAIGVASQLMTIPQMLAALARATGRVFQEPQYLGEDEIDANKGSFCFTISERSLRTMDQHLDMGQLADMTASSPLSSLETFFEREAGILKETYQQLPAAGDA